MSPVIFITGVSGYIGGHTVTVIAKKHPEYQLVLLVRDQKQADIVKKAFPSAETVIGTLDDQEILAEQGKRADVVLQIASADHTKVQDYIIEGMSKGKKGHYVHVSGTGILNDVSTGFGNPAPRVWSDVKDVMEITSLDSSHLHRDIDAAVISAGEKYGVPTAIVSPPTIYGLGAGPIKKRSLQIPFLIEAFLKRGSAFMIGEGNNIWDNVHISDLAGAFNVLTEEALKPNGGAAAWGREGYYFTDATEHKWGDVIRAITKIAYEKKAITSDKIDHLPVDQAVKHHPWAPLLWGGNCRARSDRFRALGWKPTGPSIYDSLPEMVDFEIEHLGTQSATTSF